MLPWLLLAAPEAARSASLAFRGELTFAFPSLLVFATVEGTGTAQVNGAGTGGPLTPLVLPAGVFATTADFPGAGLVGGVRVAAQNGAGAFAGLAEIQSFGELHLEFVPEPTAGLLLAAGLGALAAGRRLPRAA